MTISVAMCTYNGSAYLAEQLGSLAAQSRRPDELVVCDDHSADGTVSILREFAAEAPFPVRVVVNEVNRGTAANFSQAIRLCEGEIIALSDQDDVWLPSKLARLEAMFEQRPSVGLAFSEAELIDPSGAVSGEGLSAAFHFSAKKQRQLRCGQAFEMLLAGNVVTGAAMAFRAGFRPLILPVSGGGPLLHDAWIALLIAAVADLEMIPEPLMRYRLHPQQQTRVNASTEKVLAASHYAGQLRQLKALDARLQTVGPQFNPERAAAARSRLAGRLRHMQARVRLPSARGRRLPPIFWELLTLRYHRYSNGWQSAGRDVFF